uniref:Uncharacterized protein n=1 Tax=Aegilops tauschii subsp. strangulata TaxID=200361 RepID=A0A453T531_AEGTS
LPALQRCLEDGPDATERRPRSGFPTSRGTGDWPSRRIFTKTSIGTPAVAGAVKSRVGEKTIIHVTIAKP